MHTPPRAQTATALIFLNGPAPHWLPDLTHYPLSVAADGAWSYLQARGKLPDVCLGDFDSANHSHPDATHTRFIHQTDQNSTDFEKVLRFVIEQGYRFAHVYGASGGEQDHFLGNLSSALAFSPQIQLHFYDDHQQYFLAQAQNSLQLSAGSTVSLLPFPQCQLGEVRGLHYPASHLSLSLGSAVSLRNHASQAQVTIEKQHGALWIFAQYDPLANAH